MSNSVKRHFVTLEGRWGTRQVHYRRTGVGPLLILLHQSPQSSRELVPLMEQWSEYFTIVAPDSPGYGLSDPLGVDEAELSDFADATIEFLDAIGAGKFGIYGFHTGGMIGVAIAHGHPNRVTGFACNGAAVPTDVELEELLAVYLPRFEPRWDGSHLTWLWAKTREQTTFFPWHNQTLADRMDFPMPSPEHQQNSILEFFRCAYHYHIAYRAAFVSHIERVVPELQVPGVVTAAAWDPLYPHLSRLGNAPDGVEINEAETPAAALQQCLMMVKTHTGDTLPEAPATDSIERRSWKQLLETTFGTVLVSRSGAGTATPALIVHGAGSSSLAVEFLGAGLAESRSTLAIDLPGHGDTDAKADSISIGSCAKLIIEVLDILNLQRIDLVGYGGGACIAAEIMTQYPDRVHQLIAIHPPVLNPYQAEAFRESGVPSLQPDWYGGHLLHCWHMVRDSRLFFPWFQKDQEAIIWHEPYLDERRIQLEVSDYLKAEGAWQSLLLEQLDYPLANTLKTCKEKLAICASSGSPWHSVATTAAQDTGLELQSLEGGPETWGTQLAALLSARN